MNSTDDTHDATTAPGHEDAPRRARALRLPSARASAVLATAMLAIGVAVGAAIGPAPDASFAGSASTIAQRLPALLAALARPAQAPVTPAATSVQPPPVRRQSTPAPSSSATPAAATPAPTPAASAPASEEEAASTPTGSKPTKAKLPAIGTVWLIELAGGTFAEALAKPTAAPYITGQLIPAGTLLSGWSALSASTFAGDAALAEPVAAGATPPLLHSIVQPPCPEGPAGAACAPETPGQVTAADEFLTAALAQITTTPAYREHGVVVVTFASVAIATQSGLPAGASTATLTSQPPAGAVVLSPFAHAGAKSSVPFNPTSPRQSLEKLLR